MKQCRESARVATWASATSFVAVVLQVEILQTFVAVVLQVEILCPDMREELIDLQRMLSPQDQDAMS